MNLLNFLSKFISSSTSSTSLNLQQSIIDHIPNYYIFWKDTHSVYLGCNAALADALGIKSSADIVGKTDFDLLISREEGEKYRADDKEIMNSRKPKLNIEEHQTLPNGKKIVLLTSKVPLIDAEDNVYGILGICSDITEQKNAENKLIKASSEATQLRSSIVDHIPNYFIFWKDKDSIYLGCNAAYAQTAGVNSPNSIIGKSDYDLPWSKKESDAYRADDKLVMESKQAKLNIIEPQTLANGKKIVLLTSKVPLINSQGDVYGILGIYSDITEQKENEQKLIEANLKLELALQSKSEFVRNISHDIRTPLSGIQQTARMISDGKISEEDVPEYAFHILEASNQLMELFNQIISVSKKEHFDFEDHIVKFDVYKLLKGLKETYEVVAKHKGLTLEIEHTKDVPHYLLGKHERLHRIFLNLLGNALKFTKKGSVKLLVEKAKEENQNIILRFSIIDTGIGIPEDKHAHIFEPFSRLQPSYQGEYEGVGLGLHLVKEYIEKMDGEIYVESEEGHGSIFTCIIPFKRPILENNNDIVEAEYTHQIPIKEKKVKSSAKTKEKNIDSSTKNSNGPLYPVLLVEDNALAQHMGQLILKGMPTNYQVDVASSGEEALELTLKKAYQLIYIDIGLPKMDGTETVRQIRANSKNPSQHAFIVALTAHADDETAKQALASGMQHVLIKPLTPEKAQQIQIALIRSQTSKESSTVIDFNLWLTRVGQSEEMLEETFHMLAKQFLIDRPIIVKTYEAHDLPALQAITHKMKGALGYCGLPRLESAIKGIELAAKQGNQQEVGKWYTEVIEALDEAEKEYQKWAETHPQVN